MLNFIKEMKSVGVLVDKKIFKEMQIRIYNHINFDRNVIMSVQASFQHYCTPKKTTNLNEYTAMEIGFICKDKYVRFETLTTNQKLASLLRNYEMGEIYANVPCEIIESVYIQLIKEYRQQQIYQKKERTL